VRPGCLGKAGREFQNRLVAPASLKQWILLEMAIISSAGKLWFHLCWSLLTYHISTATIELSIIFVRGCSRRLGGIWKIQTSCSFKISTLVRLSWCNAGQSMSRQSHSCSYLLGGEPVPERSWCIVQGDRSRLSKVVASSGAAR
jgi:hypothetical protein